MKLKKKWMNYIAVGVVTLTMQHTYQAASTNHVNKVLTVMHEDTISSMEGQYLNITLKDELEEGALFYLDLEGGSWLDTVYNGRIKENMNEVSTLEIKRLSDKRLQVKVCKEEVASKAVLQIPMLFTMTAEDAIVHIKGNNTVISSGSYKLAEAAAYEAEVTTGKVPNVKSEGIMASIYIEEPFSRAFAKAEALGKTRSIQIRLNHNGYAFELDEDKAVLTGTQGFESVPTHEAKIKQIDLQTLEITLPDTQTAKYSGCFTLSGISIRALDQCPPYETLTVTVLGDLVQQTTLDVMKVMDYEITLESEVKQARAGSRQQAKFVLEEQIEASLIRTRPTYFTWDKGVTLEPDEDGKVWVMINKQPVLCKALYDDTQKAYGFEVSQLMAGHLAYSFELPVIVDIQAVGAARITASGRSLVEDLSVPVFDVYAPFDAHVKGFQTVVGRKDQRGGSIQISENKAAQWMQGGMITLELEDSAICYEDLPKIEVIKGDVRLGNPILSERTIQIPILRRSNSPSTIQISDFHVTVDQTVATGVYQLTLQGDAFSNVCPVLWKGAFIEVFDKEETKPSITPSIKQQVRFILNKPVYYIGTTEKTMDAAPYIKNGRIMMPIRYVAEAMGLPPEAVSWDHQTKTATIDAAKTVQLVLNQKYMKVNGEYLEMLAPTEAIKGRTYIPIAELTRALGIETSWDNEQKQVSFIR